MKKEKICKTNKQNLPSTLGILTIFKPIWVQKSSKKNYTIHWLSSFFLMKEKPGLSDKRIKSD
jgi:hypothetical protein